MRKPSKLRPGFVRVAVQGRNKTLQIRAAHASNPDYMKRNGLIIVPEPVAPPPPPPIPVSPPPPADPVNEAPAPVRRTRITNPITQ